MRRRTKGAPEDLDAAGRLLANLMQRSPDSVERAIHRWAEDLGVSRAEIRRALARESDRRRHRDRDGVAIVMGDRVAVILDSGEVLRRGTVTGITAGALPIRVRWDTGPGRRRAVGYWPHELVVMPRD